MPIISLPNSEQLERLIEVVGGDKDVYGIHWDKVNDVITRVKGAVGLTQADFNNIAPWSNMRRCTVNDSGVVTSYYGDPNFVENGSIGQVMVEIQKFWYRGFKTLTGYQFEISPNEKSGFKVHPAFIKGATVLDRVFMSAYEGSIYDVTAAAYLLADEQVADFTATTGDKLSSISLAKPCSGLTQDLTIVKSRILANNRGTGWQLLDFGVATAIQMLLFIEYASFNSQTEIGLGVANKAVGTGNESEITGATSFLGNTSGRQAGTDGLTSVSYRGIENFWGNIYAWVDGINIQNHVPFIATDGYQSDKFTDNYEQIGASISLTSGYISDLIVNENFDFGILGSKTGGSSTTKVPDYQYQATGNRVARLGGFWVSGLFTGFASWYFDLSSASRDRALSARLCFKS